MGTITLSKHDLIAIIRQLAPVQLDTSNRDFETSERVGAGGCFQLRELVLELPDGQRVEITSLIDIGTHFNPDEPERFRAYFTEIFGEWEEVGDLD